jgi:hypothetical protein
VYLRHYYEPDSTVEQTKIQQRAQSYQIVNNNLYKISVSDPLLRCVSKDESQEILSEIHAGVCEGHIGARALAGKISRQGFYWAAVIDNATELVSTCQACQKFTHKTKAPAQPV